MKTKQKSTKLKLAVSITLLFLLIIYLFGLLPPPPQETGVSAPKSNRSIGAKPDNRRKDSKEDLTLSTRKTQTVGINTYSDSFTVLLKQIHADEISRSEIVHESDVEEFQLITIVIKSPDAKEILNWQQLKDELKRNLSPTDQHNLEFRWNKLEKQHSLLKAPYRVVTFQIPHSPEQKLQVITMDSARKPDTNQKRIIPAGGIEIETIYDEESSWVYKHLLKRE